jgi:hypothetical protein
MLYANYELPTLPQSTVTKLKPSYRTQLTGGSSRTPQRWSNAKRLFCLRGIHLRRRFCRQLRHARTRPPRLYGFPKIHKEGVPLSSIVSNIGVPNYKLSKYPAGLPSPLVGRCRHHLTSSIEFVHTLDSLRFGPEDLMASFAVSSLFTRVPIVRFL